jgi:putative SOS response-associated peptidase YedK
MLQDNDDMPVNDAPADEGDGAPRQSYNFAPGYHGVVYRADVPDRGAGTSRAAHAPRDADTTADEANPASDAPEGTGQTRYKLQSMKWGLIPSWTKHNPSSYSSLLKTINCRSDSLAAPGGLWASMKGRKRCVVVAQGFYEWLKTGSGGLKERVPHYVKRKDGRLMFFAGLWDCVRYEEGEGGGEGEPLYTFTVVTTDSNERLKFLHDRMPVIFEPGSEALWKWLDPGRNEWSMELQGLLKPFDGELEVYPVSKEVGKVGNNSPSFVIPVASKENKANIANFFAAAAAKKRGGSKVKAEVEEGTEVGQGDRDTELESVEEPDKTTDGGGMGTPKKGVKREATLSPDPGEPPVKKGSSFKTSSPVKGKQQQRSKISATKNSHRSPAKSKAKADGSQKITKFFVGNSA